VRQPVVVVVVVAAAAAVVVVVVVVGPPHFLEVPRRPQALYVPVTERQEVRMSIYGCHLLGVHDVHVVHRARIDAVAVLSVKVPLLLVMVMEKAMVVSSRRARGR